MTESEREFAKIVLVIAVITLIAGTFFFVDELIDGRAERECIAQITDIETNDGYPADCDF